MFLKKNNLYSVECYTKAAEDCLENGEFFDSEEDAQYWVEEECWIFSGEGWFCPNCNIHFMQNLALNRRDKEQEEKNEDGLELYVGIPL